MSDEHPTAALGYEDVIAAVEREVAEAQRRDLPIVPAELIERAPDAFTLGALASKVARFLTEHPEHSHELLPELDPDTAAVAW